MTIAKKIFRKLRILCAFCLFLILLPSTAIPDGLSSDFTIDHDSPESQKQNIPGMEYITKKRVCLTGDTHWGAPRLPPLGLDNSQDLRQWISKVKDLNTDFLFILGDVTNTALDNQFFRAKNNFTQLIAQTNIDTVWCTGGGNHDGLTDINNNRFLLGFYQILDQWSQWYTVKIGNNIFVVVGYFAQPGSWASGNYGGTERGDLLNQNKVEWLNKTLAQWNGTGNNIFILRHFPLCNTNVASSAWASIGTDRNLYESRLIMNILRNYTDVVAFFNAHVHHDSNAYNNNSGNCSGGTAVSGKSRDDLPDHVHFIQVGDIWWQHSGSPLMSTFSNFRYFDLLEGKNILDIRAWDVTNNRSATISLNDTQGVEVNFYRIHLPYTITGLDRPVEYEQAWDVYNYCELSYPWYRDDIGLRRDHNGWMESRWDFWTPKDFRYVSMIVESENMTELDSLEHRIYYSTDGIQWSTQWFTQNNITSVLSSRFIKVVTTINTNHEIFIKDISFIFSIPGDLDHDNDVDQHDLGQLLSHYGMSLDPTYQQGDIDNDNDVDLSDLAELLGHYGESI